MLRVSSFDLHGKVALITGGNGGIGFGIARALGEAGAAVALAGRNEEKTRQSLAELSSAGISAIGLSMDVTVPSQITDGFSKTVAELGGVDILVANAGTNRR